MKKTLLFLLFVLFTVVTVGCSESNNEFDLAKFKEEVKTAQAFDVTVSSKSNTVVDLDAFSYNSIFDYTTKFTVALTDTKYDMELETDCTMSSIYFESETQNSDSYKLSYKLIDEVEYLKFKDDSSESMWNIEEENSGMSTEAYDLRGKFTEKQDVITLLEEVSNSIKNEKDSSNNYLLEDTFTNKAVRVIDYLAGRMYVTGGVEILETTASFNVTDKSIVVATKRKVEVSEETISENGDMEISIKFDNFKQEKVTVAVPNAEEIFDGITFDDTFQNGNDIIEVETYFGLTEGMLRYRNESEEDYFYVLFVVVGEAEYDKPLQITVTDAAGWNGMILGDSTPYSIYFKENTSFELTLNEDGTYSINTLSIVEIYDWYHNKNNNQ